MIYLSIGMLGLVCIIILVLLNENITERRIMDTRDPNDIKIFNTVIDVIKHQPHLLNNHDNEFYECEKYGFIIIEDLVGLCIPTIIPHIELTGSESCTLHYALQQYKFDESIKTEIVYKKQCEMDKQKNIEKEW